MLTVLIVRICWPEISCPMSVEFIHIAKLLTSGKLPTPTLHMLYRGKFVLTEHSALQITSTKYPYLLVCHKV